MGKRKRSRNEKMRAKLKVAAKRARRVWRHRGGRPASDDWILKREQL